MVKSEIAKFIAKKNVTAVEAMQLIDNNTRGILFIVDDEESLFGSLSDGDIRRWIIKTGDLNGTAVKMMNKNPKMFFDNEKKSGYAFIKSKQIDSLPIVDVHKRIVDILFDTINEHIYKFLSICTIKTNKTVCLPRLRRGRHTKNI